VPLRLAIVVADHDGSITKYVLDSDLEERVCASVVNLEGRVLRKKDLGPTVAQAVRDAFAQAETDLRTETTSLT
jgi:hypothetical protein